MVPGVKHREDTGKCDGAVDHLPGMTRVVVETEGMQSRQPIGWEHDDMTKLEYAGGLIEIAVGPRCSVDQRLALATCLGMPCT